MCLGTINGRRLWAWGRSVSCVRARVDGVETLRLVTFHGSAQDETALSAFAHEVAPNWPHLAPRGAIASGDGSTFPTRRPDGSIDTCAVVGRAREMLSPTGDLGAMAGSFVALGYSSGAIFVSALLSIAPELFAGAVLLRPEPLADEFEFPAMVAMPVLILSGKYDDRREPCAAHRLAMQLSDAGSIVTHHALDAGHGWAPNHADAILTRSWLSQFSP